jgi:hypothetical protein
MIRCADFQKVDGIIAEAAKGIPSVSLHNFLHCHCPLTPGARRSFYKATFLHVRRQLGKKCRKT